MAELIPYEDFITTRASSGVVKDFHYAPSRGGIQDPPFDYQILTEMMEHDATLSFALDLTVDLITHNGYEFEGDNDQALKKVQKKFDDVLDFDRVIDNVLYQMIALGDAYMECVKLTSDKPEIHALETTEMKLDYDQHGTIRRFIQVVRSNDEVVFKPEEIVYFRLKEIGSSIYSKCPFKAIERPYATKKLAENYVQSVFKNLPPKIIYFLKTANKAQRKQFRQNLIRAKSNPNIDIIASGEAFDAKNAQFNFDGGLSEVLKWLREEVITVTRVPIHWLPGGIAGANRGIGENVTIPYETKIRKLQQKVASQINKQFMPRLGFPKIKFKWRPISLTDEKAIVEVGQMMGAFGMDGDTIIEYLRSKGLHLRHGAEIEKPDPMGFGAGNPKDNATSPSKKKADPKGKMTNNLNKKGVSEAGKKKLDSKKMQTRSEEHWEYEPGVQC